MPDDSGPVQLARPGGTGEKFPPRTRVAIGFVGSGTKQNAR